MRFKFAIVVAAFQLCTNMSLAFAQQKPQWQGGQEGLNAGIMPPPGFTYANLTFNYDAGSFNDPNGKAVPVTGTYNVWAVENIFYYVPDTKFLGGNLGFMVMFPTPATGELVADINIQGGAQPGRCRRRQRSRRSVASILQFGLTPEAGGPQGSRRLHGAHRTLLSRGIEQRRDGIFWEPPTNRRNPLYYEE